MTTSIEKIRAFGRQNIESTWANGLAYSTMAYLSINNALIAIPFKAKEIEVENRLKDRTIGLVKEAKLKGTMDYAQIVAEAWLAVATSEEAVKNLRPADDPNRLEVAIVCSYLPDGTKFFDGWEIDRSNGGRPALGKKLDLPGAKVDCFLDAAFRGPTN